MTSHKANRAQVNNCNSIYIYIYIYTHMDIHINRYVTIERSITT